MTPVHLATALVFCLAGSTLHAKGQEQTREDKSALQQGGDKSKTSSANDPIEVKTDRFSNVIIVRLKPQVILEKPDHLITMEINTKLGEKTYDEWEKERIKAFVIFESQTKGIVDFGDKELHFIINGEHLNLGRTTLKVDPFPSLDGKLKPGFAIRESGLNLLNQDALGLLSKANQIEMRLGSIDLTLSKQLATTLREYATQVLAQHKITKERKQ